MRCGLLLLGFGFLFAEVPASSTRFGQQPEDGDGDDDQTADQIADQIANGEDAGPTRSSAEQAQEVKKPAPLEPVPSAVNMVSSLDRFGSQKDMKRFGGQDTAGPSPAAAAPETEADAPEAEAPVASDAKMASKAFETAKNAAKVANKVAKHSVKLADSAKESLQKARDAVHTARVDSSGLSGSQKRYLKDAEAKLREATKKAEYGQIKNAQYVKVGVENKRLLKMEKKMQKIKKEVKKRKEFGAKKEEKKDEKKATVVDEKATVADDELEAMRKEIKELRSELKNKEGEKADDDALLQELQEEIEQMEAAERKEGKNQKTHDELKSEIEKLRAQIKDMQDEKKEDSEPVQQLPPAPPPPPAAKEVKVEKYKVNMEPLDKPEAEPKEEEDEQQEQGQATPVESKGIDIDTAMPYGDLEPFGREDTAQELTEASIKESDGMVDQLERAEVSEEKRAVFRALTRLRGAAITSFDGVARSQTGNIDEYNKIHKWRNTHPLHHLADEESDVSKWAFPDNAD